MENNYANHIVSEIANLLYSLKNHNNELKNKIDSKYKIASYQISYIEFYDELEDELKDIIDRIYEKIDTIEEIKYDKI